MVENDAERWDTQVVGEPSAIPEAHLFLSLDTWFRAGTPVSTLTQQIEFVEKMLSNVLKSLSLEIESG